MVIEEINTAFGTDFPKIDITQVSGHEIQEFIPLVEAYNNLIRSAKEFDENDPESVKRVYVNSYYFACAVVIIEEKFAYKIAFKATGYLNNLLKLQKLRKICGNQCYKQVLSKLHWLIRNHAQELEKDFNMVLSQLPD